MNDDSLLKLQAYLDGELPAGERQAVADRLASDAEARGLLKELERTRRALRESEVPRAVPESREFFWSKIEREICRQEAAAARASRRAAAPWWKRWLIPAAGLAALTLVLSVAEHRWTGPRQPGVVETTLADSGALTYRDVKEGITLVWLSYPPDSGLAEDDGAGAVE